MSWESTPQWRAMTPFQRAVLTLCAAIPKGRVTTYGIIGALLNPGSGGAASQAVGNALHANPFAPDVPCHRVVRGGDVPSLGGFMGTGPSSSPLNLPPNLAKKRAVLLSEGVRFEDSRLRLLDPGEALLAEQVGGPKGWDARAVDAARALLGRGKTAAAAAAAAAAAGAERRGQDAGSKRKRAPPAPAESSGGASGAHADLDLMSSKRLKTAPRSGGKGEEEEEEEEEDEGAGKRAAARTAAAGDLRARLSRTGTPGSAVRAACRSGQLTGHTSGLAPGIAQANLVILPREHAFDFLLYCTRNPKPCPLLEVSEAGNPVLADKKAVATHPRVSAGAGAAGVGAGAIAIANANAGVSSSTAPGARSLAPGADLRTDLPRYAVWKDGVCVDQPTDISHLWRGTGMGEGAGAGGAGAGAGAGAGSGRVARSRFYQQQEQHPDARDDWVAFLLGCSFSFEEALLAAGLPVRHLQESKGGGAAGSVGKSKSKRPADALVPDPRNVPMYRTSVATAPAGPFRGPLVVSMRPMPSGAAAARAHDITARFPRVHGAPVHEGFPSRIGIRDVSRPDFGDAVTVRPGEVELFWACGVTPQAALTNARLPIAITHAPGHMLVLDVENQMLAGEARVM